jgi:hypothetical protein
MWSLRPRKYISSVLRSVPLCVTQKHDHHLTFALSNRLGSKPAGTPHTSNTDATRSLTFAPVDDIRKGPAGHAPLPLTPVTDYWNETAVPQTDIKSMYHGPSLNPGPFGFSAVTWHVKPIEGRDWYPDHLPETPLIHSRYTIGDHRT